MTTTNGKLLNYIAEAWEVFYDTVRPHHSLNLKTPLVSRLASTPRSPHMY